MTQALLRRIQLGVGAKVDKLWGLTIVQTSEGDKIKGQIWISFTSHGTLQMTL